MTDDEILDAIHEVASAHLAFHGRLAPGAPLVDALQLDSLRRLTLVVELEDRFRLSFEPEDEAGIVTVADLVAAVRRRAGA